MDVDEIRKRAHNHKWLAKEKHWSCEDDIEFLLAHLERTKMKLERAEKVIKRWKAAPSNTDDTWDAIENTRDAFLAEDDE